MDLFFTGELSLTKLIGDMYKQNYNPIYNETYSHGDLCNTEVLLRGLGW